MEEENERLRKVINQMYINSDLGVRKNGKNSPIYHNSWNHPTLQLQMKRRDLLLIGEGSLEVVRVSI